MRRGAALIAVALACGVAAGAGPASAAGPGGLVLEAADVPGLSPGGRGAAVARRALGAALPRVIRGAQRRGAAFSSGGRRLRIGVFVAGSRARAARGLRAATRGAKRTAGIGDAAFRRSKQTASAAGAVVVFRLRRAVAAVRYTGPRSLTAAGAATAAQAYAEALEARLRRALSRTAWQRVLDGVRNDGSISARLAIRAFAIAFGSVPGARRPAGRLGTPDSGTLAVQLVARVWDRLTAAQRRAVERALGAPHDASSPPLARAADQVFTPSPTLEAQADAFAAFYAQEMGTATVPDIRVFTASEPLVIKGEHLGAYALPVGADGYWGTTPSVYCDVRVGPEAQKASAEELELTVAHETFHCMQFVLTAASWETLPLWIMEGTAVWASIIAADAPKSAGMKHYGPSLQTVSKPVPARSYDAISFWARADEVHGVAALWHALPQIIDDATLADAFALAGGTAQPFVDTWASSSFRFPGATAAWYQRRPYAVPHTEVKPPATILSSGTTLGSSPYALHQYDVVKDPSAPLVNVTRLAGSLRAGTPSRDFGLVQSDWFCLGKCACPKGTAGTVPTHYEVDEPRLSLGLSGGAAQGGGRVTYHDLEEFCDAPATGVSVSGATSVTIGGPGYCVRPFPGVFQVQLPLNQGGQKIAQVVLEVAGFTGAGTYPTGPSVATVYDFRKAPAHLWDMPATGSITVQNPGGAAGEGASGTVDSVTSGTSPELGTTTVTVTGTWSCV